MPRSVAEWIGKSDDDTVPDRVRLRIWRRQCGGSNFCICPLSGLPLSATDDRHLDHEVALIDGGRHAESNLRFVHASAHREKTASEVAIRAKNDARAKKHAGIKGPSPMAGRDRETINAQRAAQSKRVSPNKFPIMAPRRSLFQDA